MNNDYNNLWNYVLLSLFIFLMVISFYCITFGNAYISVTNIGVALDTYPYIENYSVFEIGAKDTFFFLNNRLFFGYDASYLSPISVYPETFPYFPLGYASYDFYVGLQGERWIVTALHNCTHQFVSASMELPWHDGSFNSLIFEIIF